MEYISTIFMILRLVVSFCFNALSFKGTRGNLERVYCVFERETLKTMEGEWGGGQEGGKEDGFL